MTTKSTNLWRPISNPKMKNNLEVSPEVKTAILEFMKIARDMPLSKRGAETSDVTIKGGEVTCPHSKRLYDAAEIEVLQDQVGSVRNLLHPSLRSNVKGMCPVVCIKCREVVSWLDPAKDNDGFVLDPKKLYHIHHCPQCEPKAFSGKEVVTELIEKQLFLKYR